MGDQSGSQNTSRPASQSSSTQHGRHLTWELLVKAAKPGFSSKAIDTSCTPSVQQALSKLTHLHLNGLRLAGLGDCIQKLVGLETLYLYDNLLQDIADITTLTNLQSLYLQNNRLVNSSLQHLASLTSLKKLYIEGNQITCVCNLERLSHLEELHIGEQRLQPNESLSIDESCMTALGRRLQTLSAVNCRIQDDSLTALAGLHNLHKLELGHNELQSLDMLEHMLTSMTCLTCLDLRGNPVCKLPRYRENVVLMSDTVSTLDGDDVLPQQREILMRLQVNNIQKPDEQHNPEIIITVCHAADHNQISVLNFEYEKLHTSNARADQET